MTKKSSGLSNVRSNDLLCAICNQSDPDMECNPTVHPDWSWEWVHIECLRDWEHEANKELCRELQAHND